MVYFFCLQFFVLSLSFLFDIENYEHVKLIYLTL